MAWKLRKDKLQEDAANEGTGEAAAGHETAPEEPTSPAFSLSDTAVDELEFMPDAPATAHTAFHTLDLSAETPGHHVPEEPYLTTVEPSFEEPVPQEAIPLGSSVPEEPSAFSPFVPFQSETPPSPAFLDRSEVAPGLASQSAEDHIPRVAPFIVDVPPTEQDAPSNGMLVVRIGNLSANFTLTKEITTIGRPDSVAQSYPDVEIELDDAVSRRHAEIRHRGSEYYLVDLMSTNGTMLNGQRVAGNQELRLLHGDRIRMGDRTEIVFE